MEGQVSTTGRERGEAGLEGKREEAQFVVTLIFVPGTVTSYELGPGCHIGAPIIVIIKAKYKRVCSKSKR